MLLTTIHPRSRKYAVKLVLYHELAVIVERSAAVQLSGLLGKFGFLLRHRDYIEILRLSGYR